MSGTATNTGPDGQLMRRYCVEVLPKLLHEGCEVDGDLAAAIGADVLARAEAVAALPVAYQHTLAAPFVEEAFDHKPDDAPVMYKALVTAVVRNSRLEDAHAAGPVDTGGITVITEMALAPLSHLFAFRRRHRLDPPPRHDELCDLDSRYPRAWSCLTALTEVLDTGGRRLPCAERPGARRARPDRGGAGPRPRRHRPARRSQRPRRAHRRADPRRDDRVRPRRAVHDGGSALSRLSRKTDTLLRIVEFFLARGTAVLTTNYMLRPADVWVRRGRFVKPDSTDPWPGLLTLDGLTGSHWATVRDQAGTLHGLMTGTNRAEPTATGLPGMAPAGEPDAPQ
jgi:hypothetical protein